MKRLKALLASVLVLTMLAGCLTILPVSAAGLFDPEVIEIPADKQQFSFEAESDQVVLNGKKLYVEDNPDTSGGKILRSNGKWEETQPALDRAGDVQLTLVVPEDGIYCLWVRNSSIADTELSLWVRLNDEAYVQRWLRGGGAFFQWNMFLIKFMKKGSNTVDIVNRDGTCALDCFLVSTTTGFAPNGLDGFGELETAKVAETFNAPPVLPPENQHPRLMFTERDLPAIKHAIETIEPNKVAYKKLVEKANIECDGKLDPLGNSTNNGQTQFLETASAAAFLYALDPENNYDYAKKAYNIWVNYANSWMIEGTGTTLIRPTGDMMRLGAEIYDWCYDALTPEEKDVIYQTNMQYMGKMSVGWPPTNQDSFTSHAVESQIPIDMMSFANSVYDEHPEIWDVLAGRVYQEIIPAQNFLYRDGPLSEGSDYSPERLCNIYYLMHMMKRMGYPEQFDDDSLKKAMYTWVYKTLPNGGLLNTGDAWNTDPGVYSMEFVSFMHYTFYKDPYMKHLWMMTGNGNGTYTGNAGNHAVSPALFLILNTEEIEEKTWYDLPLVYHYGENEEGYGPESGLIIRSDWKKAGATGDYGYNMELTFQPYQLGSHQHLNSGAFQIYYGNSLAIDSGVYNSAAHIDPSTGISRPTEGWGGYGKMRYTALTIAHNCMLIRGEGVDRVVGQSHSTWNTANRDAKSKNDPTLLIPDDGGQIGDSASHTDRQYNLEPGTIHEEAPITKVTLSGEDRQIATEMLGWDSYPDLKEPDYAYISGDLTYAYPAARVDSYFRSFVYLNLNEEGEERKEAALIVYDNMKAEIDGLEKIWLLHTQEEPTIENNRITLQRTEMGYDAKMINDTLLPAEPTYELIGGRGREFEVNGMNRSQMTTKSLDETGKWRVEIGTKYSQKQDDFLNVIQIGRKNSPVYDTELVQNDDTFVGTKVKNRVVMISKSKTKYKRPVEVSYNGEHQGDLSYIVTGLAKGRWSVMKGDEEIATYDVAEAHPTLNFKAPAGTYTLRWSYLAEEPDRDMTLEGNTVEKNRSLVKTKIGTFYVDFEHPMVEMNGTQWLHAQELLNYIGYEPDEYSFSEDGRSLNILGNIMTVSDDPNETNALKIIDGEIYVPVINMAKYFSLRAYWYPVSNAIVASITGRVSAADKARIFDWKEPNLILPMQGTQSTLTGTTNVYDALDDNEKSYCYAGELNEWIQVEFKEPVTVDRAEIYWHSGHKRKMKFEIQASSDGKNFTTVYAGESDGETTGYETFKLAANSNTKYIRIIGLGNTVNDSFSVNSMKFFK